MKKIAKSDKTDSFDESLESFKSQQYHLKLYVTGMNPHSLAAVENLKQICEQYLKGRYFLEVVDLYKNPSLAKGEQIIAAPTLIKKLPLPLRRIIGNMSSTEKVLIGLDLREIKNTPLNQPGAMI